MLRADDGEVAFQDGERVDEHLPSAFKDADAFLYRWPVLATEEAGALLQRLAVHFGQRAHGACGIPLHDVGTHFAAFHLLVQGTDALRSFWPRAHLTLEEPFYVAVVNHSLP